MHCPAALCRGAGLVFQIVDDILDVTATTEELGKPVGSDAENDKTTFITLYGWKVPAAWQSSIMMLPWLPWRILARKQTFCARWQWSC